MRIVFLFIVSSILQRLFFFETNTLKTYYYDIAPSFFSENLFLFFKDKEITNFG